MHRHTEARFKVTLFSLGVLLLLVTNLCCITIVRESDKGKVPQPIEWTYTKNISQPITALSGNQLISVGNLNDQKVSVALQANSFDSPTQVTLTNPGKVPPVMSNQITPLGAPIEITSGSQKRLNKPVTVKLKIDGDKYAKELQRNDIWVTYYNGKQWEYFIPDKSDAGEGAIYFSTYHFCLFGQGKIDMEERISKYTHSQATAEIMQGQVFDAAMNNVVANALEDLMLDKYQVDEDSLKSKIITSLVNDDEYGDIVGNLYPPDGNRLLEANKKLNVIVGKKIAENIEGALQNKAKEAFYKEVLGNLASDTGQDLAKAGVEAAAHAYEGQYSEAVRIAGEAISNSFMLTNLVRGAGEMVQGQIDQWKDKELEAAYQAYKNGADNGWWGYNVGKLNFGDVWNQMRGLSTKIESDAVNDEINRRKSLHMRDATPEELDAVRAKARDDLKKQFENRAKKDAEVQQKEAELHKLVLIYDDDGLLDYGSPGYEDIMSVEHRLDTLLKIRNRIVSDTGRKGWSTSLFTNERAIGRPDLIALTRAWLADSTGEAYYKELKKRFPNLGNKQPVTKPQEEVTSACDLTIEPESLQGVTDTPYNFKAKTGRTNNVYFDWYINGDKVATGPNGSISPTFNVEKTFEISVTMFENGKEVCYHKATAIIKKKAEQAPPTVPPLQIDKRPETTAPQTQGTGWYLDGPATVTRTTPTPDDCNYFGKMLTITPGSAIGVQSWKDCSGQSKCSGAYTGNVNWTTPPSFMQPGSNVTFTMSEKTTAQNTCGYRNLLSSGGMKIDGALIIEVMEYTQTPSKTYAWTVKPGSPGNKLTILVNVTCASLYGSITYNYTYR
jgi:hypothetical protein